MYFRIKPLSSSNALATFLLHFMAFPKLQRGFSCYKELGVGFSFRLQRNCSLWFGKQYTLQESNDLGMTPLRAKNITIMQVLILNLNKCVK